VHGGGQSVRAEPDREIARLAGLLRRVQRRAEPGGAARPQGEPAEVGELAQLVADPVGIGPAEPFRRGQPQLGVRLTGEAQQCRLDLEWSQPPRLVRFVQRGRVLAQPPLPVD
jgi:hypothetical protein